jgi:hypothetical protein
MSIKGRRLIFSKGECVGRRVGPPLAILIKLLANDLKMRLVNIFFPLKKVRYD